MNMKKMVSLMSVLMMVTVVAEANRTGRPSRPADRPADHTRVEDQARDRAVIRTSEKELSANDVALELERIESLASGKDWEGNFRSFQENLATKISEGNYAEAQALLAQVGARAGLKEKDGKTVEEQVLNCK